MIAIVFSLLCALLVFVICRYLLPRAWDEVVDVSGRVSVSANSSLTQMFIFIEPKQIIYLMMGASALTFILVYATTEILLLSLIIAAGGAYVPKLAIKLIQHRRQQRFLMDLPDALLSIASMLRAGSNLPMALEVMVSESRGPIAQEFGLFLRQLSVGVVFEEALDNLYKNMPVPELQLVVAGMKISREIGGSLADVLARLSDTIRRRIEMEGKIKSLTAQGKMQGWVMSLLPLFLAFLISKIEPEAMARLFTEPMGWGVCAVVAIGEYIGYRFIKKIVSIDV